MFDAFAAAGYRDAGTADGYGTGRASRCWAIWGVAKDFPAATRFTPLPTPHGHEPDIPKHSVRTSLERLRTGSAAILHLAYRDSGTPPEDTLRAVDELHREGVFGEFGLSNFGAADVPTVRCCAARRETGSSWGASSPAHLTQNLAAVTEGPLPGRRDQRHRRRRRNCPPKLAAGLAHHLTQTASRATAAPQNRVIGFTTYVGVAR
jgi:hypothetical protein